MFGTFLKVFFPSGNCIISLAATSQLFDLAIAFGCLARHSHSTRPHTIAALECLT